MKVKAVNKLYATHEVLPQDPLDIILLAYIIINYSKEIEILKWVDWQFKGKTETRLDRVHVAVSISPSKVVLSEDLSSIRVTGRILKASLEEGLVGRTLGIDIKVGESLWLRCNDKHVKILNIRKELHTSSTIIIIFDDREATIAILDDYIREVFSTVFSGRKYYVAYHDYIAEVEKFLIKAMEYVKRRSLPCIVASPSIFKRIAIKYGSQINCNYVEVDIGGLNGIFQLLKKDVVRQKFGDNKIIKEYLLTEYIPYLLSKGLVIYGKDQLSSSINGKALHYLIVEKKYVIENFEYVADWIMKMLMARKEVLIVDKASSLGVLASRLGGVFGVIMSTQ